ncbi:hypothetical protein [Bosea sp. (in: a-proteobacteria)]|jgi:hypothetical protein|uniref:hypothetical protein n=1 Tax=Bosea sp. (in: a-proteobacteria) TaxID=1871050 RepID=UPI0035690968
MTAETHLLRCLRRSVLGAWLAVVYALAVLASALAPSAASAYGLIEGAVLCSGLTPPGQDAPEPASEPQHCKGCPVNPALAGPGQAVPIALTRVPVADIAATIRAAADAPAPQPGLPPSHAPPVAGLLRQL